MENSSHILKPWQHFGVEREKEKEKRKNKRKRGRSVKKRGKEKERGVEESDNRTIQKVIDRPLNFKKIYSDKVRGFYYPSHNKPPLPPLHTGIQGDEGIR